MGCMAGMGLWMLVWGVVAIVVLALAVVGVVWLVQRVAGHASSGSPLTDPAETELRRRYAAGEISRDEYLQSERDLRQR